MYFITIVTLLSYLCIHTTATEFDGEQKYGYYNIREGTHMFYWFLYSTHPDGWQTRPLLIWHEGGPGTSSTGFSNFGFIGPLNYQMDYRETTWIQECNVMFIDSPVGSGWSYVDGPEYYTTDMAGITADLTATLRMFLDDTPELKGFPLYFFGQSYGGKVAAAATLAIHQAVQNGELDLDIQAFVMGNGWLSPLDSTLSWSKFIYEMSVTDEAGRDAIDTSARRVETIFNEGDHVAATYAWISCYYTAQMNTNSVIMYNILHYTGEFKQSAVSENYDRSLFKVGALTEDMSKREQFMNTVVREMLNGTIPDHVTYGAQGDDVFEHQMGDFLDNEIEAVNTLLTTTDIQVVLYQGQLDITCCNAGAMLAVQKFEWEGKDGYYSADRVPLTGPDGDMEMFVTAFEKFKYYWVLNAGHAAVWDVPQTTLRLLRRILADADH